MIATIDRIMGANLADADWFNFKVSTGGGHSLKVAPGTTRGDGQQVGPRSAKSGLGSGRQALEVNETQIGGFHRGPQGQ